MLQVWCGGVEWSVLVQDSDGLSVSLLACCATFYLCPEASPSSCMYGNMLTASINLVEVQRIVFFLLAW